MSTSKFGSDYQACAHAFAWASKHEKGENYGNRMFFENDTIYSYGYHFIIAKKVRDKNGNVDHVLFNSSSWSVTTSKQQGAVRQAIRHQKIIEYPFESYNSSQKIDVVKTAKQFEVEIFDIADKLTRARSEYVIEDYKREIFRKIESIDYLASFHRVKSKLPVTFKNYIALKDDSEKLLEVLGVKSTQFKARKKRERTKAEKAKIKKQAEEIQKWRNGELNRIYLNGSHDILRIGKNGQIETSQGISIELPEAKRLLRLVDLKKAIGEKVCTSSGSEYPITKCNGIFSAGCHNIKIDEIEAIREFIEA